MVIVVYDDLLIHLLRGFRHKIMSFYSFVIKHTAIDY